MHIFTRCQLSAVDSGLASFLVGALLTSTSQTNNMNKAFIDIGNWTILGAMTRTIRTLAQAHDAHLPMIYRCEERKESGHFALMSLRWFRGDKNR